MYILAEKSKQLYILYLYNKTSTINIYYKLYTMFTI